MERNTDLPCANSMDPAVWKETHEETKRAGWDDPQRAEPAGEQRCCGEVLDVAHCRGCGSTLFRARAA